MKAFLTSLLVIAVSCVLSLGLVVSYIFAYRLGGDSSPSELRVEQGDTLASVARKLHEKRLIANERLFSLWGRVTGVETKIHLGLYRFDAPVSTREILERLSTGRGMFHKITIPEGLTVKEIAALLEKTGIADAEKFLAEAAAPELLESLGLDDLPVEGYLFPSTYYFTPETPERDIVRVMVEQFRKATAPLAEVKNGSRGLESHEIITLASIIEKETGIEAERPIVSAVFHNRLKLNMPLQSDPTVIYGLSDFQGNLTRKNLQQPGPYNTYKISGLPPGPICNPGLSSIRAALDPAPVSYLYFVSRNDGTHVFSDTLEAHNEAVKNFQPSAEPKPRRNASRRRP